MGNRVLVTGGAGYVGSQTAIVLRDAGFEPVILDNLSYGHREPLEALGFRVIVRDTSDRRMLESIFRQHSFDAVMHFAAYAYVGESVLGTTSRPRSTCWSRWCRTRLPHRILIELFDLRNSRSTADRRVRAPAAREPVRLQQDGGRADVA